MPSTICEREYTVRSRSSIRILRILGWLFLANSAYTRLVMRHRGVRASTHHGRESKGIPEFFTPKDSGGTGTFVGLCKCATWCVGWLAIVISPAMALDPRL